MKREHLILGSIVLFTLSLRLALAFLTPNFSYDSYFHLRQIGEIAKTGWPVYQDPLSYGGRELVFLPAFQYLLGFFGFFFPPEPLAKILSNLLMASLVPLAYLISKKITKNRVAPLFAAFFAGFAPVFWQTSSLSPYSLFLPLILLAIYSFISLPQKKFLYLYLFSIFFLSLTSSATFLLIIGLFFYLLLSKLEEKKTNPAERELAFFSLFLFLWLQFLFFKNTLLTEGLGVIWRNIPPPLLSQYFPRFSILQSLLLVGLVPLLAGIFIIYQSLFREKNRKLFFLFSLALSTVLLFLLNLVELKIFLMFLALLLALIFSPFYQTLHRFSRQTKFASYRLLSLIFLFLILALASVYPSLSFAREQITPSPEEIQAFLWLKENTLPDSTILATLKEGHLLTYFSQRKNLMDSQFSLIKNIEERFSHLNSLFTTPYQTQAIDLLNQYKVDYLLFSPLAKKEYQTNNFPYLDKKCFELAYSNVVQIYKSKCQLQPTKP